MAIACILAAGAQAATAPAYRAEIEAWREKREARLRAPHGWLAVSGLYWLQPGPNILPPPYEQAGVFELKDEKVFAHAQAGTVELKDDDDETDLRFGRYILEAHASGSRRAIRVWDTEHPRRKEFPGLLWFPIDEKYRIKARFIPYKTAKQIVVQNLAGDEEKTDIKGYVSFPLSGRDLQLIGWEQGGKLLFVFRDETSGKSTYPTARFLVAEPPKSGEVGLDFNKAYNPPCVFSSYATCPLPPKGNQLPIAIEAGEKLPPAPHP